MANAAIFIGWTRAYPGHEQAAMKGFGDYINYLTGLQRENRIEGFEPVFLRPHGGDLNGFILVRGDAATLNAVRATDGWKDWETWGGYHLDGFGSIDCMVGSSIADGVARWGKVMAG
jgi:hypothetical protein